MPSSLSLSFVTLVALLYSILIMAATYAENSSGSPARVPLFILRIFVGGFILLTGLAALSGFFLDFASTPPRVFFGILPAFVGMLALGLHSYVKKWLQVVPLWWLVAVQAFRIVVEVQLYFLARTALFPKMMTIEGANFDIVTGVTAPIIAILLRQLIRSGNYGVAKRIGLAWNVVGLLLLTNVVVRGLLSVPTKFQMIFTDPPNLAVGYFPFIWLPMFVVPFAYLLHIWSIRQMVALPTSALPQA